MLASLKTRLLSFLRKKKGAKSLVHKKHDFVVLGNIHGKKLPNFSQVKQIKKVLSRGERQLFQWSMLGLIIGLVWGGMTIVGGNRTLVPDVGGRYTEGVVGAPQLINPLFASLNEVDQDLVGLVYSGLMRYDKDQQLIPDLAEWYEISEDRKTYTFYLRQDVTWHSGDPKAPGQPFTANDVAFTFDLIQDEEVGSPLAVTFQGVDVTVIDDYTVSFTLPEPFQPFLASLTVGMLPSDVWAQIPASQIRLAQLNVQPVGTGPFRFFKLVKNQSGFISRYELAANEQFYREKPYIEEFAFEFFTEYDGDFGVIKALREGKIDAVHFVPSNLRSKVERKHIAVHTLQLPQYSALFFNEKRQPLLEDETLRMALALGIDKQRVLKESLDGEGNVIESPILPGFPGYSDTVTTTPYSTSEANNLLDENWERMSASEYREERREALLAELAATIAPTAVSSTATSSEGTASSTPEITDEVLLAQVDAQLDAEIHEAQTFFRKDDDGNLLELTLVTAATEEYHIAAELIAGFWQELGIKTTIREVDPRNISRETLKDRRFDVLLYGLIVGSDPDQYPFWHSSQTAHPGLNLSQYVNRSTDELLEKIRETDDPEELAALYAQVEAKILEDRAAIFLYTPVYRYAQSTDVRGFDQERIFRPTDRLGSVTDWYVETKSDWTWGE